MRALRGALSAVWDVIFHMATVILGQAVVFLPFIEAMRHLQRMRVSDSVRATAALIAVWPVMWLGAVIGMWLREHGGDELAEDESSTAADASMGSLAGWFKLVIVLELALFLALIVPRYLTMLLGYPTPSLGLPGALQGWEPLLWVLALWIPTGLAIAIMELIKRVAARGDRT